VEVALKYDSGKRVPSRIPEAPDQIMYTVCGDDTIYLPLHVAEQIEKLGIKKMELISICKTVRGNVTRWEVKRLSEAAEPASGPQLAPSIIEQQLTRSIAIAEHQKAQQALVAPAGPVVRTQESLSTVNPAAQSNNTAPIRHTTISEMMASALIAAFDATQEAERYAHSHGVEIEFGADDIRAISNTIFIQLSNNPGAHAAGAQKVNGGAQPWPQ
jgi:hypothetical protein